MKTNIHPATDQCQNRFTAGKALVQSLLIMGLLLASTISSYAQTATNGEMQGANRLFLPLVAGSPDSSALESGAEESLAALDPTEDMASDYEALVYTETTEAVATVEAAASSVNFFVTKTADTNDGVCSLSDCSLREAAIAAAADPTTHDTISIFVGVFPIAAGPLPLVNVSLLGAGIDKTIIEGASSILAPPMNTIEIPLALTYPDFKPVANTWIQLEKLTIRKSPIGNPAAGIKHSWGKLTLKQVRIQKHQQGIHSAPINLADSKGIFLVNSDIDGNDKGLLIEKGSASFESSVIRNSSGLGVELRQSQATLANTTLTSNGDGGLALFGSNADLFSSALIFNKESAIFLNGSTLNATASTISSNDSTAVGAGLGVDGAGATVWVGQGATANLNFVTIAKNKVPNGTASLYVSPYGTNTVLLGNSIVADNLQANGGAGDCKGTLSSAGYTLVENITNCTLVGGTGNMTGVDPKLGALAFNSGKTKNHLPASTSLAVDAIPFPACPTLSVDQRSLQRPRDGNGDGVWGCDMGAIER